MGIEVTAMTYIGIYVNDAEAYLIEKGILKEGVLDEEYGGDFKYAMDQLNCPLHVQAVSYYSDEGYYVGFETYPSGYRDFDHLIAEFKEITGDDARVETFEHWY